MERKMAGGYEYEPFTPEEHEYYSKYNTKYDKEGNGLIRVGKSGCVLYKHFLTHSEGIRNLEVRSDDVFLFGYPRSGTTLTQELVWLINNNLDFEKAKSESLLKRFPFIEFYMIFASHCHDDFMDNKESRRYFDDYSKPVTEALIAARSQRFIKSHLHMSLLPAATINTAKVVYVARDMRDVAVSTYHYYNSLPWFELNCSFKEYYYNVFCKNMLPFSSYFHHLKEGWAFKDHPNMLFLNYKELSKDLKGTTKRVAQFFGKDYTDQQLDELCDHLAIENFRTNASINLNKNGILDNTFIRKGKAGGWREVFDEEMAQHAERLMKEELQGTGINFET